MASGTAFNPTELETLGAAPVPVADELHGRFELHPNPNPASDEQHTQIMSELKFGVRFTDHLATARWTPEEGWHHHRVSAYGNLELSPAAAVLHYGQEVFEGLKAYRHDDGSIWMFRPGYNGARFQLSSRRLSIPELPIADFVASLVDLVRAEARWVPDVPGSSLYLRPFAFASEPFLGVRSAQQIDYYVIASPVGPYFPNGFQPVSIWVSSDFHRAGPGGTGAAKCGGNYAASLLPQSEAAAKGYEQVCFLDAATNTNLEELGGMNVFAVMADGTVRTPELTGTILEGGTRSAILRLLRDGGATVREETIALADLVAGIQTGEVVELFACGTAAVVTPIGRLGGEGFEVNLESGPVTAAIYQQLTDIQNGKAPDPYGWTYRVA